MVQAGIYKNLKGNAALILQWAALVFFRTYLPNHIRAAVATNTTVKINAMGRVKKSSCIFKIKPG